MKESKELAKNLESSTVEFPDEYTKRAQQLIDKRKQDEEELRKSLTPFSGRDDRLSSKLNNLDIQLRKDIAKLREEFNLS